MQRGTQHTEATKAKMSVSQKKRPPASAESRAKMSASRKAYFAKKKASE